MEPDGTPASPMRGVWSRNAEGRQDSHESEGERWGNRRRGTRRMGAATALEWRAVRPEAMAAPTAPVPALLHGAVRKQVAGEAGTGDARGAAAASRGDARCRRSRPGRARRGRRRARRVAPSRGGYAGPANDAVELGNERVVPAAAASAASRRASGARSDRRERRREGLQWKLERAQRAEIGTESPVAKRRAQTHRTVPHTRQRHRHHRLHRRLHQRQDRRHRHRHQRRRHHERWHCRRQPVVLRGKSGGAAAERGAAGAVRREGVPRGGGVAVASDQKGERAAPGSDAARDAPRPMRGSAGPGCRAAAPGPRGCR